MSKQSSLREEMEIVLEAFKNVEANDEKSLRKVATDAILDAVVAALPTLDVEIATVFAQGEQFMLGEVKAILESAKKENK